MLPHFRGLGTLMIDRRRFLQSLIAAAASPAMAAPAGTDNPLLGPLRPDPNGILDLPDGFGYRVVSRAGATMSDELKVPPAHDGMAVFEGENGRVVLVCNHEMRPSRTRTKCLRNVVRFARRNSKGTRLRSRRQAGHRAQVARPRRFTTPQPARRNGNT